MATPIVRLLARLRNRRDLRAEIADLAATLAAKPKARAVLQVGDPAISSGAIDEEWERVTASFRPDVRSRMSYEITEPARDAARRRRHLTVPLSRPNFTFEVLRALIASTLQNDGPENVAGLIESIGASQTPIRSAVRRLVDARVVESWQRGFDVDMDRLLPSHIMSRLGALPQTVRFRYERGAPPRTPAALVDRAKAYLDRDDRWQPSRLSISGTAVALQDVPSLDLVGVSRLDLVAQPPLGDTELDLGFVHLIDAGLELEPNPLAPAALVVTVVRAVADWRRDAQGGFGVAATPADVFLSLLDQGMVQEAHAYSLGTTRP